MLIFKIALCKGSCSVDGFNHKIGRVIKTLKRPPSFEAYTFDVSNLPADIYTLMYFDGRRWRIEKFIKK